MVHNVITLKADGGSPNQMIMEVLEAKANKGQAGFI